MNKKSAKNSTAAPQTHNQACNVALLGFGTVGSSVAKILCERPDSDVRLTHILNRNFARKKVDWLPSSVQWTENIDDILSSDANVVVEVMGGLQPTEDWIRRVLSAGKSVVTANKQIIAHSGPELISLAAQMNQQILYGASVAGGVPVISGLQSGLAGDELFKICGILNGTCNYILSQMESKGVAFADALREAQKLGFAEANPAEDIDGLVARAKLTILARVGLHCNIEPETIAVQSISRIEAIDFEYASQLGCTIRQISWAEISPERLSPATRENQAQAAKTQAARTQAERDSLLAAVGPAVVALSSPLARVEGSQNLVVTTGTYGGETVFGGHGAGGHPTAVAVVSDILAIAHSKQAGTSNSAEDLKVPALKPRADKTTKVSADYTAKHYLRFFVKDQPGIIACLATILSSFDINIDAVLQKPGCPKTRLPFLITLEECKASLVERALRQLNVLEFMVEPCLHLPIL
jgi:homoserine dehydrogenase